MIPTQFEYLGRWVDTKHFCAFVYSDKGEMLAKSYQEFIDLIGSGIWFASKTEIVKQKPIVAEKPKDSELTVKLVEKVLLNDINVKRESTKNALKAATNLGK